MPLMSQRRHGFIFTLCSLSNSRGEGGGAGEDGVGRGGGGGYAIQNNGKDIYFAKRPVEIVKLLLFSVSLF